MLTFIPDAWRTPALGFYSASLKWFNRLWPGVWWSIRNIIFPSMFALNMVNVSKSIVVRPAEDLMWVILVVLNTTAPTQQFVLCVMARNTGTDRAGERGGHLRKSIREYLHSLSLMDTLIRSGKAEIESIIDLDFFYVDATLVSYWHWTGKHLLNLFRSRKNSLLVCCLRMVPVA